MSASARAVNGCLRARRDVTITANGEGWVVKDPLSLEYFRLGPRERFLFAELQEPLTVTELTRRYREAFPNERGTGTQVLSFCSAMIDCALLLSDSPGLAEAREQQAKQPTSGWANLLSPLALRLPGVDPTPLLRATDGLGRLLFSRGFALALAVAAALVAMLLVGEAEALLAEAGRLANLFEPKYAAAAVLALVITKTWHELGHALACRRMGAECHEIGVMLLALMPCLYCDVSDAWTLPSRWRRALVALAGVYFEALLAVAAAAAWLLLAPGPLRVLALYVVAAASISTLLINLNPLLRFDGYYVLADLWGVSNLHQVSRQTLWGPVRRWVRGDAITDEPPEASAPLLALYGAASTLYGWAILVVILWTAYHALDAWGFAAAGDVLVALTVGGVLFASARSAFGLFPRGLAAGRSLLRAGVLAGLLGLLAFGLLSIEIEQSLHAPCRLESGAFADIAARSDGLLAPEVQHGMAVEKGAVLAVLEDPVAEIRRLELLQRQATLVSELAGLQTRSQTDPELLSEIARLRPTLAEVRRQLAAHEQETDRRVLRAPFAGRVVPPARRPVTGEETPSGELPTWAEAPLDNANAGCLLERGETLCRLIGTGVRAVVLLNQDDSGLLRVGDPVRVLLDRETTRVLEGAVEGIALAAADERLGEAELGLERSLGGSLDRNASYRVTVGIGSPTAVCQPGAIGQARIATGRETVGQRCLRWLRRLIRLG